MNTRFLRAASSLLLCGFSILSSPFALGQEVHSTSEELSTSDWQGIREAYEGSRHELREFEGGHQATNPGQQLQLRFDGLGLTARPTAGDWTWGLQLQNYGFANDLQPVTAPKGVEVAAGRLAYQWSENVEEWFINDTRGLEHGFTVTERPKRVGENDVAPLVFELSIAGDLTCEVNRNGRTASFLNDKGAAVLHYSGLTVFDADGESLEARLESSPGFLRISVEEADARYPLTIDPVVQQGYLKASNPGLQDQFGESVAVSGDTIVVGVRSEDSNSTGVNGDEINNSANQSGAAYVFVRTGSTWSQEAYLKASNTGSGDNFGESVGISGDTIIVGSIFEDSNAIGVNGDQSNNSGSSSGAAYVFVRSSGVWAQEAYLKASNTGNDDRFGIRVAIDGDTAVVGAIFEDSSSTGVNGDDTDNSTPDCGAAYVFTRAGTTWSQQAYLKSSNPDTLDRFGVRLGVSGDTIVVGAMTEASSAVGVDGDASDNSSSESGAAFVYFRSGTTWTQQAYLKASNTGAGDNFGRALAISGDTIVVGAPSEDSDATGVGGDQNNDGLLFSGAVYVFGRTAGIWGQLSYLKSSTPGFGDLFGSSVGISNEIIVIGAFSEDSNAPGVNGDETNNSMSSAGAAYIFAPCGSEWAQAAYLKAANPDPSDNFGNAVAISGDTVIIAAMRESSSASGVDGDPFNNDLSQSGAAYVFDLDSPIMQFCGFPNHCNGDGGDQVGCSDCPCSNNAVAGTIGGCLNSTGNAARLSASGDPSVSLPLGSTTDLRFALEGALPAVFSVLFSGSSLAPVSSSHPCFGLNSGVLSPAFDGLRCASLSVLRHGTRGTDLDGDIGGTNPPWGGEGNPPEGIAQAGTAFVAGQVRYFQAVYREDPALSCMTSLNTTQAIEVTFTP